MAVLTHFRNPTEMRVCDVQLLYQGLLVIIIVMLPPSHTSHQLQPDAPLTWGVSESLTWGVSESPCTFVPDTVYATPTPGAEGVFLRLSMTSKWECCSICRRNPLCFVGNFVADKNGNHGKRSNWNMTGDCFLRGQVDTTKPTHKPNVTACVVRRRAEPVKMVKTLSSQ